MEGAKELLRHYSIPLEGCGPVTVYIQGDLDRMREAVVFLTVHDVYSTHQTWITFANQPCMEAIQKRSLFLHVAVPGQEPGAGPLPRDFAFPSLAQLGLALVTVLDRLRVPRVVGLGDGAGANIITRFCMMHPTRVHGVITVNNTAATSGLTERVGAVRRESSGDLNESNVARFAEAFRRRSDITGELNSRIRCDLLLLAGTRSRQLQDTEAMHRVIEPGRCSIIKVDDVMEPLVESPEKVAKALLLFCQGMGLLATLGRSTTSPQGSEDGERREPKSMEDYDRPNIRRLSLASP